MLKNQVDDTIPHGEFFGCRNRFHGDKNQLIILREMPQSVKDLGGDFMSKFSAEELGNFEGEYYPYGSLFG